MLVLTRKLSQKITCIMADTHIEITISKISKSNQVSLGIEAPPSVTIVRNELLTPKQKNREELDAVTLCGLCNVLLSDDKDNCPHCGTLTLTYYR